ncbi:GNAT family N-acetyltransferase [Photobacterium galatheae]|uniref:GNAT family acetyltransferase n=1 Tax=Photobacterium galatheae TaxID=1654360 RepID=A0A066RWP0_9GAMM|nr:GNAT family N-acetyltransferase [Photobacterium galatheae]KDM93526.1 GNAT family acetyltransferase [Photobacterium galatheae]MCM0151350.1 GNAT family N-acetyltransferase [Photobacterium galatheae]
MELTFREAQAEDLEHLVGMLADDILGSQREDASSPLNPVYLSAFQAIQSDANNSLVLAENEGQVMGMLQLTYIPSLTLKGSWRCLVEGVRIHSAYRGLGCGEKLFEYAIDSAKRKGCAMIQLTSDKLRPDAIRFYEKLGFTASHQGMKMKL